MMYYQQDINPFSEPPSFAYIYGKTYYIVYTFNIAECKEWCTRMFGESGNDQTISARWYDPELVSGTDARYKIPNAFYLRDEKDLLCFNMRWS
jgi:hypothetical protein